MTTAPPVHRPPKVGPSIRQRPTLVVWPEIGQAEIQRRMIEDRPRVVVFLPGEYQFEGELQFPGECEILGGDAVIRTTLRGTQRGHRPGTRTKIHGGTWLVDYESDGVTYSPLFGSVFSAGPYFDDAPTVHGFEVTDCMVETNAHAAAAPEHQRTGGNGIAIYGDCSGFRVANIRTPTECAHMGAVAAAHWGRHSGTGAAGSWQEHKTLHPSGVFSGISAGRMLNTQIETCAVRVSGADLVQIQHVTVESAPVILCIYDGDEGWINAGHPVGRIVTVDGAVGRIVTWAALLNGRPRGRNYESCQIIVRGMFAGLTARAMRCRGVPPPCPPGTEPDHAPSPSLLIDGEQLYR